MINIKWILVLHTLISMVSTWQFYTIWMTSRHRFGCGNRTWSRQSDLRTKNRPHAQTVVIPVYTTTHIYWRYMKPYDLRVTDLPVTLRINPNINISDDAWALYLSLAATTRYRTVILSTPLIYVDNFALGKQT